MKNWKKIIISLGFVFVILISVVLIARWRVVSVSDKYIFDKGDISQLKDCQDVLILGAGVREDGSMSPILEERAITAKDLYTKGKACKIIITGLKKEVEPVKRYLIDTGVPQNLVVLDGQGIDTITSIKNAHDIYNVDKAIIITQDFHLNRAVYLAKKYNIEAVGYKAYKYYPYIMLEEQKYIIRDWLASIKALWQAEINK